MRIGPQHIPSVSDRYNLVTRLFVHQATSQGVDSPSSVCNIAFITRLYDPNDPDVSTTWCYIFRQLLVFSLFFKPLARLVRRVYIVPFCGSFLFCIKILGSIQLNLDFFVFSSLQCFCDAISTVHIWSLFTFLFRIP